MKPSRFARSASALLLALACAAAHAQHRVDFTLDLNAEIAAGRFDPAKDQVGLRGATPPLDWGRTLTAHAVGGGRYALTIDFAQDASHGQPVQYKIKIDHPGGAPDAGWEQDGNRTLMLMAKAQTVERAFGSAVAAPPLSRVGTIERLAPLPSKFLPPRGVQVWLPPGYAQHPQQRYPVLYLHDGQNVFDAAAAGAEWRVDESAQAGVESGQLAPFIIVAVDNTAARMDEYTPVSMINDGKSVGGKAPAYARYLIEELKPFIDAHYRSLPDAAHTAVGGSSLGGLVSLWLAVHHADTFGAALVVSPSVWWADSFALRDVAGIHWPDARRPKLWVDVGGREGNGALQGARKLHETLLHHGWSERSLSYLESPKATHDEAAWAVRVPAMLKFLYGR
ncbi:MAG TPA: alpha/beta hydrolase-fold protein [Burkholderiaceae bacterium]|jgi:predicted alpha/beta superfamily hydrolase